MKEFRLNIDGKEVIGLPSQTILDVAKANGIDIPTLCFDERTEIYGACGLCVVEVEGNPKLVKACATDIAPGMVVKTNTDRVLESRKTNLELLLSNHKGDCRPPCALACPAGTDCQGYVGLIANGQYEEALELIKDNIPLPAAIGRVCPHPCETECRRGLIEEPVSIAWHKRFAADMDLASGNPFIPEIEEETEKSVGIIGGGPYGLSLAYFLRSKGHAVTIFEAMPKAGGMLRYGIPEYRLPNEILDMEIATIEDMGVEIITDTKIGVDIEFESLREEFDAIAIGIGAWVSTGVGVKGEDADGVIGGIDILRKVVRNEEISLGKNVAIVGGGNTAMDACRTAVRLGAENVYNVYRRTKDEMPADEIEIIEGEEEGVIFKNLRNPLEIKTDKDGHVKEMVLQVMELGEPDESGRRRPMAVKGKKETLKVDNVILAIGQAVEPKGLKGIKLTKKKGIIYDKDTFMTNIPGVFAGGDCGNDKISIAVESIADAKKASAVIDAYLFGEEIKYEPEYVVERDDITEKTFEDRERQCRPEMSELTPEQRKDNFTEVVKGYTPEQAEEDAMRCLECGCGDYFECKLIDFANEYDVKPDRFAGDINAIEFEDDHPFIIRDPNKCILCGLCVRACDEVMGIGALGLVNRGFDTIVKPTLEKPLVDSGCVSCGQCVSVCPTGALQERLTIPKSVPLDTVETDTTCPYCSVGCSITLETYGNMLIKSTPDKNGVVNKGLLCGKGRFGFDCAEMEGKLVEPLIKMDGQLQIGSYYDAFVMTAKKMQSVIAKYGKDAAAIAVSDRFTNEEAYAIKALADTMGTKIFSFNNRENGMEKVIGVNASPNAIDELLSTEVALVVGFDTVDNPVIELKLKQAAEAGVKVVLINPEDMHQHFGFAEKVIYTKNTNKFLKEIAKAVVESDNVVKASGFKAYAADLDKVKVSQKAADVADLYINAKKAMIVFQQNNVTTDTATLLTDIAVTSGHIGSARDGILQVKAKNNSQGLVDMGIVAGAEAMDGVKGLIIFGEDPDVKLSGLEHLTVIDTHLTKTGEAADVVIPGSGFASVDGTYTNSESMLKLVQEAYDEDLDYTNWEIVTEIANIFEVQFPWVDTADISAEMEDALPKYRYSAIDEVFGGVFTPVKPTLIPVANGKMVDKLACTDNLMNMIAERLPKPAPTPADVLA